MGRGRSGHKWRLLQAQVFTEEWVCWLCHQPVDMTLHHSHPYSKSVDHIIALALAPALAEERSNLHLAHRRCNIQRGNRERKRRRASRAW